MPETYPEVQKQLTKESISTALLKLLEKKPFHEITVTQITSLAGVSRMAFYRNYNTKEDIIVDHLDDMFDRFTVELEASGLHDMYEMAVFYFTFFRAQKHYIEILLKSGLADLFYNRFCSYLATFFKGMEDKNSLEYGNYFIQYESGGIYNVLLEWIKNDTKESPEVMARLLVQFTT